MEQAHPSPERTALLAIRLDDTLMTARQSWTASLRRERLIWDFTRWKDHDAYQPHLHPTAE